MPITQWLISWPFVAPSPFVQRVWISMEVKGIQYQYIEVDPYKKPETLMKLNPRGLVPTLQHGDWACYESTVLMEYVRRPLPVPTNHTLTFSTVRGLERWSPSLALRRERASARSTLGRSCTVAFAPYA